MSRIRMGRGARSPRPGSFALTLSDDFREWVLENAIRGVLRPALIDSLVQGGVPPRLAAAEVDAIVGSPALAACARRERRIAQLELVARLQRAMASYAPGAHSIDRRDRLDADEFFGRYLAASRPVVLTGMMERWPALGCWSPAYFKERLGGVEIEVMTGRAADPDWDRNFEAHRQSMTMGEFVDRVIAAGRSDDIYLVARNDGLARPVIRALLEEICPPADIFDPARIAGGASLWFGPAGTVTPLHHDTTSLLFCQMYGKKRVQLVSPLETALLPGASGFYAEAGADTIARGEVEHLAGVDVREVVLEAGEALLIPAGWWHEVTALEISINLSLLHIRRPNDVSFYRPGSLPR